MILDRQPALPSFAFSSELHCNSKIPVAEAAPRRVRPRPMWLSLHNIAKGYLLELESGLDRLNAADRANLETVRAKVAFLDGGGFPAKFEEVLEGLVPGGVIGYLPSGAPDTPAPSPSSSARVEGSSEVEGKGTHPRGRNLPPEPPKEVGLA